MEKTKILSKKVINEGTNFEYSEKKGGLIFFILLIFIACVLYLMIIKYGLGWQSFLIAAIFISLLFPPKTFYPFFHLFSNKRKNYLKVLRDYNSIIIILLKEALENSKKNIIFLERSDYKESFLWLFYNHLKITKEYNTQKDPLRLEPSSSIINYIDSSIKIREQLDFLNVVVHEDSQINLKGIAENLKKHEAEQFISLGKIASLLIENSKFEKNLLIQLEKREKLAEEIVIELNALGKT